MSVKQVIVLRTDLNMRKGKMAAQACHASLGVFIQDHFMEERELSYMIIPLPLQAQRWLVTGTTKIAVGIPTEHELHELAHKAKLAGIPYYVVTDAGRTEFGGKPTVTCMALGPWDSEEIDKLTGDLKLL